jgi:hypothetical protein
MSTGTGITFIRVNTIRNKYLVTPFFVDQLSFNLTSFRHYRAFIRSEKICKIVVSINDSIAKITSVGIKVYKVNQLLWESARVHNVNTGV